uniref:Threonine aspartase 1-like n=1 Tax=Hirondellea gigas TaxID=1518452 RepID=A0A2P2I1Z9_9CRUS
MSGFIALHVGVGNHSIVKYPGYRRVMKDACKEGQKVLRVGGTAVEAVRAAVAVLEACKLTNAGVGSSLTNKDTVECDACVMDGRTLRYGAVAAVPGVRSPVTLAARVLTEQDKHITGDLVPPAFLAGEGARAWAEKRGIATCHPSDLITDESRALQRRCMRHIRKLKNREKKFKQQQEEQRDKDAPSRALLDQKHAPGQHRIAQSNGRQRGGKGNGTSCGKFSGVPGVEIVQCTMSNGVDITYELGVTQQKRQGVDQFSVYQESNRQNRNRVIKQNGFDPFSALHGSDRANHTGIIIQQQESLENKQSLDHYRCPESDGDVNAKPTATTPTKCYSRSSISKDNRLDLTAHILKDEEKRDSGLDFPAHNFKPEENEDSRSNQISFAGLLPEEINGSDISSSDASDAEDTKQECGEDAPRKRRNSDDDVDELVPNNKMHKSNQKTESILQSRYDTVGCVAVDCRGDVASAVSSGGLILKSPGRVGQAAVYGAGCWAENDCEGSGSNVASCSTGCGEMLVLTSMASSSARAVAKHYDGGIEQLPQHLRAVFLDSKFLRSFSRSKCGGCLVLRHDPSDGSSDLCCFHSASKMAFAYMGAQDDKPKTVFTTLPPEKEGEDLVVDFVSYYPSRLTGQPQPGAR